MQVKITIVSLLQQIDKNMENLSNFFSKKELASLKKLWKSGSSAIDFMAHAKESLCKHEASMQELIAQRAAAHAYKNW